MIRYVLDRNFSDIPRWHIMKILEICNLSKFIDLGSEYALAARFFECDSRSTYAGKEIYKGKLHISGIKLRTYLIIL